MLKRTGDFNQNGKEGGFEDTLNLYSWFDVYDVRSQ